MDPIDQPQIASGRGFISRRLRRAGPAAWAAAAFAGPVVLCVAACLGWTLRWWTERENEYLEQTQHAVARAVAPAARAMLERGETAGLHDLVRRMAEDNGLTRCAVVLADGGVVADSDPSRVTVRELPESWSGTVAGGVGGAMGGGHSGVAPSSVTFQIAERGSAAVVVSGAATATDFSRWGSWGVPGVIGLAALGALGGVLRWASGVLRPLRAVQTALRALAGGEGSSAALAVSPRWGAEAEAWNTLLEEREAARRGRAAERIVAAEAANGSGDGALERACDALPQGMIVLDPSLRVRYANGAAGVLLQAKRAEMAGKPLSDLCPDERVIGLAKAVGERGERRRGSVEVERGQGEEQSLLRYSASRLPNDPANGTVLLVEDLTQQRVADKARDSFVAQATHELRAPLTNIRLYVETLLEEESPDPKTHATCINVINQETRRLERMVGDMLSVAEIEAGSMKLHSGDVRLEPLFEELVVDYKAQADEKELSLTLELPPKLPVVQGDRDKLAMTLHNLLGNAIKYTPAGGVVAVKVETEDGRLAVNVKDNGIGIAPSEAERIFEKFYRSNDRRVHKIPGTGLGLALAREVARLHGGDITVRSQVDQGSTFTLTLPVSAKAA